MVFYCVRACVWAVGCQCWCVRWWVLLHPVSGLGFSPTAVVRGGVRGGVPGRHAMPHGGEPFMHSVRRFGHVVRPVLVPLAASFSSPRWFAKVCVCVWAVPARAWPAQRTQGQGFGLSKLSVAHKRPGKRPEHSCLIKKTLNDCTAGYQWASRTCSMEQSAAKSDRSKTCRTTRGCSVDFGG